MAGLYERIFHRPVFFTALLAASMFTYFGAQGSFATGILTTLQRDFKLKSSEIGLILTINDITGLIVVTPLAYFGAKSHRPRVIGILSLIFALGCIISTFPQFIGDSGRGSSGDSLANDTSGSPSSSQSAAVCVPVDELDEGSSPDQCSAKEEAASGAQYHRAFWLFIGQALCGIGGAGYFPLGISYIDDGVKKTSASIHVASLFMMGSLCPVFAFGISAFVLSYHTDFYKIDVNELGYDDSDPRWIGAWWLGYMLYGAILILTSIPYFFFPKKWPHRKDKADEAGESSVPLEKVDPDSRNIYNMNSLMPKEGTSLKEIIKGYFFAMGRLLSNVTYVTCLIAVCAQLALLAGFFSFVGRYIQTQYDVTPSNTSVILGCIMTPAGFFGNFFGGLIVKKLKLSLKGLAKMAGLICLVVVLLTPLNFAVGCSNRPIAGITVPYPGENELKAFPSCLEECMECPSGTYAPVCGPDGITYLTPCHAGCTELHDFNTEEGSEVSTKTKVYTGCTCMGSNMTAGDEPFPFPHDDFEGVPHACPRDCFTRLVGFLVIFGVTALVNSLIKNPSFMLKLRCVEDRDRAISLGLGSLLIRVLGFVPAPIYFGAAIQKTCLYFQEQCGKTGNCLIYDMDRLRNTIFGLVLILKIVSALGYTLSYFSVRRDKQGRYRHTQLCCSSEKQTPA
ncbi:solute carrier organic anion transporter family member 3A1-like [Diadema setosum]|uniref:solute carrier organic anion transporter family member 3A1-like n=1 Tax=Diadema setosum TaxID=31175 RepID=UPI003B3B3B9B